MTISEIVIYTLIGVAVFGIIVTLIWTKLIRPYKISYTSSSFLAQNRIKKAIRTLINKSILLEYWWNVAFKATNLKAQAVSKIAYSKKNIYLISDALYWNVLEVKKVKNEYVTQVSRKTENHSLPYDVTLFIEGAKFLRKNYLQKQNVILIVPALNKNFKTGTIDNIYFIKMDQIQNFIIEQEKNGDLISDEIINKLKSIAIVKKRNKLIQANNVKNASNKKDSVESLKK